MTLSKLRIAAALLLTVTFVAASAGRLVLSTRSVDPTALALAAPAAEVGEAPQPPAKEPKPQEPAIGEKLEALWADLASDDEAKAWRAAFALARAPKDAATVFKARLKPITVNANTLAKLIRDLDDEEFDIRERASTELKTVGELAVPLLRKALDDKPSVEMRRRIVALLAQVPSPSPAWTRAVRAVTVLEEISGDDALKLLEATANGQADALPTRAAKSALQRLGGKPPAWPAQWDALAGSDEAAALRAAFAVVAAPKEALPFIKKQLQLRPTQPGQLSDVESKLIENLIAGLGSADFDTRQKSMNDLIAKGPVVVPLLRKASLTHAADVEIARRLDLIMKKLAVMPPPRIGQSAVNRTIVVMAYLDTAESRDILAMARELLVQGVKLAMSPDGGLRVLVDPTGPVSMVDATSGKVRWITQLGCVAGCVAFSPDGKIVAAGSGDGLVHIIDAATGKQIRILRGHTAAVVGISFSGDGTQLKSVDSAKTVRVWDGVTGRPLP
jgi:hypothetical protein